MRASRAFTGAWIETPLSAVRSLHQGVAPSRARGLKRIYRSNNIMAIGVAPSRARGLKQSDTER